MKYKPMPRYVDGVVVPYAGPHADSAVGRMFIQPWVETMDGRRVRLDDELGRSFALIGIHVDPASALGASQAAWWQDIGARFVHVLAPRSGPHPEPAAGLTRVEDVDGAFRDWLLRRPGDCVLVLRPDRYVAAVCGRDGLDQVTTRLRALL
jgi:3-(3-hydroxy-phenyl)propionate hydroxylase